VDITTLAFIAFHVTKWINGGVGPGSEKSNMVDSVQEELGNKYHISTAFKDDDRWSRWLPCCICVRCMLP
jgi:hypothetical protein